MERLDRLAPKCPALRRIVKQDAFFGALKRSSPAWMRGLPPDCKGFRAWGRCLPPCAELLRAALLRITVPTPLRVEGRRANFSFGKYSCTSTPLTLR